MAAMGLLNVRGVGRVMGVPALLGTELRTSPSLHSPSDGNNLGPDGSRRPLAGKGPVSHSLPP